MVVPWYGVSPIKQVLKGRLTDLKPEMPTRREHKLTHYQECKNIRDKKACYEMVCKPASVCLLAVCLSVCHLYMYSFMPRPIIIETFCF